MSLVATLIRGNICRPRQQNPISCAHGLMLKVCLGTRSRKKLTSVMQTARLYGLSTQNIKIKSTLWPLLFKIMRTSICIPSTPCHKWTLLFRSESMFLYSDSLSELVLADFRSGNAAASRLNRNWRVLLNFIFLLIPLRDLECPARQSSGGVGTLIHWRT